MNREAVMRIVREYVAADPESAPLVAQAASEGVHAALMESLKRAADMESLLAVALARKYPGAQEMIRNRLREWEGRTALNWKHLTETT